MHDIFDERMGADDDIRAADGELVVDFVFCRLCERARQQSHTVAELFKKRGKRRIMRDGKYFRRCHESRLISVFGGAE